MSQIEDELQHVVGRVGSHADGARNYSWTRIRLFDGGVWQDRFTLIFPFLAALVAAPLLRWIGFLYQPVDFWFFGALFALLLAVHGLAFVLTRNAIETVAVERSGLTLMRRNGKRVSVSAAEIVWLQAHERSFWSVWYRKSPVSPCISVHVQSGDVWHCRGPWNETAEALVTRMCDVMAREMSRPPA